MKPQAFVVFLFLIALSPSYPQVASSSRQRLPYEIRIAPEIAQKLLIHKVDPTLKCVAMMARVSGTVVVDIEIGIHGEVLHASVISGPKMLRQAVLDAVRQYKYKPYEIKRKPFEIETTVSVHLDSASSCP